MKKQTGQQFAESDNDILKALAQACGYQKLVTVEEGHSRGYVTAEDFSHYVGLSRCHAKIRLDKMNLETMQARGRHGQHVTMYRLNKTLDKQAKKR